LQDLAEGWFIFGTGSVIDWLQYFDCTGQWACFHDTDQRFAKADPNVEEGGMRRDTLSAFQTSGRIPRIKGIQWEGNDSAIWHMFSY